MSDAGPIELVYSVVGNVLDSVQNAAHLQSISDFIGSIRWQEPFILGIIGLQFFLFVVTYLTRKNDILQFSILFCLTLVALAAERLNDYGRAYWRQFASQDYFDRAGLFMLIFVCGPFIILANFIAIGMFLRLVKMYARNKRREARIQRRSENSNISVLATGSAASGETKDKKID